MVHEYFKRNFNGFKVLVQVNPANFSGMELTINNNGTVEKRKMRFDEEIFEDLEEDGFEPASPLEFNLYLKGLAKY
ncbi:hypothetical protein FNH22_01715 [Fulvivirga sp. M361]|uniref:hypothetical protein n=1 Tax=Fulvivirga sp. M361 TaxID=2594266 RepID=UPI00117A5AC5|nr:hypothetical protein [Fulvivirga sp. M361]TRX62062.1 hypothetical protein FNH22_01715 [Fulvivirga sp. M361]